MKILLFIVITVLSSPLRAADTDASDSADTSSSQTAKLDIDAELDKSRALIRERVYKKAISALNAIVLEDQKNANAWNLIGYSQRKLGNYAKAKKAYAKALKFNPEHKGALEYQGELFITLGEYKRARGNHQKLKLLCPEGCEQLDDLALALEEAQ